MSDVLTIKNISNIILREPGGTKVSEKIREILLDNKNCINKEEETLMFLSSRANLVNNVIIPKLNENHVILCDRFIDSTVAYQSYGRGMDLTLINKMNKFATNDCIPVLTIIFDIDPKIVANRFKGKSLDRMEVVGLEFQKKVREGYLDIAKSSDRYHVIQCDNKNIEQIHTETKDLISLFIKGIKE